MDWKNAFETIVTNLTPTGQAEEVMAKAINLRAEKLEVREGVGKEAEQAKQSKAQQAKQKKDKIFSLDCESDGLSGVVFAIGVVVLSPTGEILDQFSGRVSSVPITNAWVH